VAEEAMRFAGDGAGATEGVDARLLVDRGVYDVRRVAAAPNAAHGPGRYAGDACVCVLAGSVTFTVEGRAYQLRQRDVLWVPAGVLRAFAAGPEGAELLAVHLPRGSGA
jgi:quercetin dioxygenase-like cupin family protein